MSVAGKEVDRFMQSDAFRASYQGMSRKATHEVDEREYTSLNWALLPGPASSAESQRTTTVLAEGFAKVARARGGAPVDQAVQAMVALREDLYMNWVGQYLYFYLGPPRYRPLPVMLGTWMMMDARAEQLPLLAGSNATDLVEPPIVEDFHTAHLGTGVKVLCVQKTGRRRKSLAGLLGYAFRSEELETDLHLKTMCTDLGWLQAAMPGIEEFARAIRLIPKSRAGH